MPRNSFVDVSHIVEDGMVTYKGLPAPLICDYLSREASRSHYSPGTEFHIGQTWQGEILKQVPAHLFRVSYFDSVVTFALASDGVGGTDLTLTDAGVAAEHRCEVTAGWVSVLMALKGAADFGVDLRNHDPDRTWRTGFADN